MVAVQKLEAAGIDPKWAGAESGSQKDRQQRGNHLAGRIVQKRDQAENDHCAGKKQLHGFCGTLYCMLLPTQHDQTCSPFPCALRALLATRRIFLWDLKPVIIAGGNEIEGTGIPRGHTRCEDTNYRPRRGRRFHLVVAV